MDGYHDGRNGHVFGVSVTGRKDGKGSEADVHGGTTFLGGEEEEGKG